MLKKLRLLLLFSVPLVAVMVFSAPAQAYYSEAKVRTFLLPNGDPAAGETVGRAYLNRSRNGVRMTMRTSHLVPGDAYTIWWIIFNNPWACDYECGDDDIDRPEVEASVLHATGRIANSYGRAKFSAFLPVGFMHTNANANEERHLLGPGLQNAISAEIHVIVRSHGKASGDVRQLATLDGDCNVVNSSSVGVCFDIQVAVFRWPKYNKY